MKNRSGFLRLSLIGIFSIIGWIFALLLIVSRFSALIDPTGQRIFALFALAFPMLFIVNILMFLLWLAYRNKMFATHLLVLLICIPLALNYIAINKKAVSIDGGISVITYNLHGFRGFQFSGTEQAIIDSIAQMILKNNADVVCVQEFLAAGNEKEAILNSFVQKAGFSNYSFEPYYKHSGNKLEGLLIMSKFPLLNKGSVSLPEGRTFAAWAEMEYPSGAKMRVVNIHLASFSFARKEVELLGEGRLIERRIWEEHGKSVAGKFLNTYVVRAEEMKILVDSNVLAFPSLIVAGDFNDTPSSFTYRQLKKKGLNDTFKDAGWGIGASYAGGIPLQRIDYIFVSPSIESIQSKVLNVPYSDHFPVLSIIKTP